MLAQRYEALRQAVVQHDSARQGVRGIALLMRQGVAGWMRAVAADAAAASHREPTPTSGACVAARSASLEQLLVNIVAAMALVHAKELIA